ncbi:YbaB/EbfC family nucleoid-associated protein [Glycomyces buryatensis]|uniref:YbaB/EbfC family nucleoid-associated protein n=1 Tax=Glycomyces buryatensis TaxID=2570927 RepID=A0A4S8QCT9_9ACTN|nr:YbaB/EbfC family nucleoid-associated protein [Glycomyces buryatensis]THV41391.1 hypothetical protein FAB82_11360 [Glycomyces buryatensis]
MTDRFADPRAREVMQRIEAALARREHETFEHLTESGHARACVNLRGRLVGIVFLEKNILRVTDRESLAAELQAAITAAQGQAEDAAAAIAAEHYAELG